MSLKDKKCVPCEGGATPLSIQDEEQYLDALSQWDIDREGTHKLSKTFAFEGFLDAIEFINAIASIAEEEGHHPNISIYYNRVLIELYTHALSGLSINDFILAAKIDYIHIQ